MNRREMGESLALETELIPEEMPNRKGGQISARYLTIHNTSNEGEGANADAHSRFVRKKGYYKLKSGKINYVSWHYSVDDKKIIKHLPVNERAIHAGKGNAVSIGIEICMHKGIDQEKANDRAARLVACLMHDLMIPKSNIRTHQSWTKKMCPVLLIENFAGFCESADGYFSEIQVSSEANEARVFDNLLTASESEKIAETQANPTASESDFNDHEEPDDEHGLIATEVMKFAAGAY